MESKSNDKKELIDFIQYRRSRSFETLNEINELIYKNMLATAMNRIYYAGFYIVSALMLFDGFSTSKHRQLIGYFNREFVKSGKIPPSIGKTLQECYNKRLASDYHDFVYLTKSQVENYNEQMGKLINHVDKIISDKLEKLNDK